MTSFVAEFNHSAGVVHPLEQNLRIAKNHGDFSDLGKWANWVLRSDWVDYLSEEPGGAKELLRELGQKNERGLPGEGLWPK